MSYQPKESGPSDICVDEIFEVDGRSFSGSDLIHEIVNALQQAYAEEKTQRGLTQEAMGERLGGINRSVVNKWLKGRENMTVRTIGELAWAMNRRASFSLARVNEEPSELASAASLAKIAARPAATFTQSDAGAYSRFKPVVDAPPPVVENV